MSGPLRVSIVDDEEPGRRGVRARLERADGAEVAMSPTYRDTLLSLLLRGGLGS